VSLSPPKCDNGFLGKWPGSVPAFCFSIRLIFDFQPVGEGKRPEATQTPGNRSGPPTAKKTGIPGMEKAKSCE
jgi:hypothetical protein